MTEQTHQIETQIRDRAYAIWMANGCMDGHDMDFWLQAEKEVLKKKPAPVLATGPKPLVQSKAAKAPAKAKAAKAQTRAKAAPKPKK